MLKEQQEQENYIGKINIFQYGYIKSCEFISEGKMLYTD